MAILALYIIPGADNGLAAKLFSKGLARKLTHLRSLFFSDPSSCNWEVCRIKPFHRTAQWQQPMRAYKRRMCQSVRCRFPRANSKGSKWFLLEQRSGPVPERK